VLCDPLVASPPLQPPEAAHVVALLDVHVSVDVPPEATVVGLAVRVAVGVGKTATETVAVRLEPPAPVQISEYEVLAVMPPMRRVPLALKLPDQPPEAVQGVAPTVAPVELHVSVVEPPLATLVGAAVRVTVGAGSTVTVADAVALLPPGPEQVRE
jgi:hypothetical protein